MSLSKIEDEALNKPSFTKKLRPEFTEFVIIHYSKKSAFISVRIKTKNQSSSEQAITACLAYIESVYGSVISCTVQDFESQEIRITVKVEKRSFYF